MASDEQFHRIEKRLAELELLALHYQREHADLNQVVLEQAREIDGLRRELAVLNERLKYWNRESSGPESEEPPPPHY